MGWLGGGPGEGTCAAVERLLAMNEEDGADGGLAVFCQSWAL